MILATLVGVFSQVADAQTARFKAPIETVTVPLGYNGTFTFTNVVTVSGLAGSVALSASGLPSGVTATIQTNGGGALPLDGALPSVNANSTIQISLTFDGTEAQGVTTASLLASDAATNNWNFNIQVAALWTGGDFLSMTSTNWTSNGNWAAGTPAGVNDDVIFGQSGATNVGTTNVYLTSSKQVASMRFNPTNNTFKAYTFALDPNVVLSVGGSLGFSMMKDTINALNPSGNGGLTVTMIGSQGGLVVTNPTANFVACEVDNSQASLLDLSGLGQLTTDINQFAIGDYSLYPNYRNLNDQNAYGNIPRAFLGSMNMARTNVIRATYVDPFNYTNADARHFSFSYLNTETAGSTSVQNLNFGISNAFYLDSINFGGGNSRCNAQFLSAFASSNPVAIFRGTNGGRMSVFSIADAAGTNTAATSPNNNINFMAGSVDILADRFYIGRDRKMIAVGQNPNYAGNFLMQRGNVDVNNAVLGFREYNQTNASLGQVSLGYCRGTIVVSNTATFKVANSIWLGSTVATNGNEESTAGNCDQGQIYVQSGGIFTANMVLVGGPSWGVSRNNIMFVSNSLVVVTNSIGGTNQALDTLTLANGAQLKMTLNSTSTVAAIYATNFNVVGSNSFVIAAIKNPSFLTDGLQIPLFKRYAGAAPNVTVFNQSGVNGQIVTDGTDPLQQNFQVILSTPKNLVWKGTASATWDTTSANWQDVNTLLTTNFAAGDNVTFNDSASQFNIGLDPGSTILPGSVTMANTNNAYQFNNNLGGTIIGSSTLTKFGTNSLTVDAVTSMSVVMNAGQLLGSSPGTLASVTINSGASMDFSGTISGNLSSAGVARSSGTVNGSLFVLSGGVVTNANVMNGSFTVNGGGLLVNNPGASFANVGASASVSSQGTLINRGNMAGQNINISGTFKDTGEGSTTLTGTFTANPGATIIPGGDGVGSTTIQGGAAVGFPGRVLLSQGSTNIFKVDIIGSVNTRLLSGYQDYGGSSTVRSQNGCTIVITNVTGSFAAGQSFTFFQYSGGGAPSATGTSTNTYPVIVPATPGPGLVWDLTQLWPSGVIGVMDAKAVPFLNSSITRDATGTNIIAQFDWPSTNIGWRLINLTVPNNVGIGPNTNYSWSSVPGGTWTNLTATITNIVGTNSTFYRLVYP